DMIQKINDAKIFKSPVVTEVVEASQFFPAETYHQDYHKKNPAQYKYYQTGSGRQGFITRVWDAIDNKIFEP
ncbi:MAG: peptide-methionine (S)-S-oxide reductase, partial [Desulfobacter sp.]|nr:peptide-methionine (S)-S-oxide reductase [Desulfobacter sp.]